jgi:DNA sulfur modification protein DndD
MLVKSLKVRNFRQFRGEQILNFAIDSENNVTVVMGANGSGKTSLAQAFTWCLYGETDFKDKSILCKAVEQSMAPNTQENVFVQLVLEHKDTQYTIRRIQRVRKEYGGHLKEDPTELSIGYKTPDGQSKKVEHPVLRIKEILPQELSRYFFFDGERMDKMRAEIGKGKSREFAEAVRSLLGLDAIKAAISHLRKVIRRYDESCDPSSDAKMRGYARRIGELNAKLEQSEEKLITFEDQAEAMETRCNILRQRILQNKDSEDLARQKERLEKLRNDLLRQRDSAISQLLSTFNSSALDFFAVMPMQETMKALKKADKLDKGIPDIHARTLDYLLARGVCLCGCELRKSSPAFMEIEAIRQFIPPKSIGTALDSFAKECGFRAKNAESFFGQVEHYYSAIRNHQTTYGDNEDAIRELVEKLKGREDVGHLQSDLSKLEHQLSVLRAEREKLIYDKGGMMKDKERQESERGELALKDKANRSIQTFKAYAQELHNTLNREYSKKESEIRRELEETVNAIFQRIYKGGFSLALDEKYNITINVTDGEGWRGDTEIETSTAQGISVCFAFIAGVIELARKNGKGQDDSLSSEAYPLVMDAPLSSFDKTRIQTVCSELPKVAEQVIIFIKDTDGELAEEHLGSKVGKRYTFDKCNEFETVLREGK